MAKYKLIKESEFKLNNSNTEETERIFQIFKDSYEKNVGKSWSYDKFLNRANNWTFFGDENGFVAVRIQNSGLYKLVGVAGNLKSIIKGFNELNSKNVPIWGMVDSKIKSMISKFGYKTPNKIYQKILMKMIPKNVFGNVNYNINNDGSITLNYSDVGQATKYFVGNDKYFSYLKKELLSKGGEKVKSFFSKNESIELNEKRSNPEVNIKQNEIERVKSLALKIDEKNLEHLTFCSFRSATHTTLINPNNQFETPTGVYCYPFYDYLDKKIDNLNDNSNIKAVVPFTGNKLPQYLYFYILKDFDGIVSNKSTLNELKKYFDFVKNDNNFTDFKIAADKIDHLKESIDELFTKGSDEFEKYFKSKIDRFWHFIKSDPCEYLWAILVKTYKPSTFSKKAREMGLNGFIDYGSGYIHSNERYQAVFFRSRSIFQNIEIVKLGKSEEFKNNPIDISPDSLRRMSKREIGQLFRDGILKKISNNLFKFKPRSEGSRIYLFDKYRKPLYDYDNTIIDDFNSSGFATIITDGYKYTIINTKGEIIPNNGDYFTRFMGFNGDYARVKLSDYSLNIIDKNGEYVIKDTDSDDKISNIHILNNGFFRVEYNNNEWGLIDVNGNKYPKDGTRFEIIEPFKGNVAKVIFKPTKNDKKNYGLINNKGEIILNDARFIGDFINGFARIIYRKEDANKVAFIDTNGNQLPKDGTTFREVKPFYNGFGIVKYKAESYGYIDTDGNPIPKDGRTFMQVSPFNSDGTAYVQHQDFTVGYIDTDGNPVKKKIN